MGQQATADILAGLDKAAARIVADMVTLYRDFPAWAVWLPVQGTWIAIRPASIRPPNPELPMIWVRARSARQLAGQMRAADQTLGEA
jgi:hypothetical protein